MKKSIAFGTAVSLFAMSAVVAGAESTLVTTSLGLKLTNGSLENVKEGDKIIVVVYTENEGETPATFSMETSGVKLLSATVPTALTNLDENGAFNITTPGESCVKGKGTVVCTFEYEITDPANVHIEVKAGDFSEVGANAVLTGTAASEGDDSSSDDSNSDSNSSTGDSDSSTDDSDSSTDDSDSSTDDSDSSTDDSNSSTDDSNSSTDDSDSSTDDSNSSTDDSDSSTDDSNSSTDDSNSSTDDSNSSTDDSNSSADDSNTSGSGTSSNSGSSTGTGSGSKDPGNVDTGIGFVLAPAILAGAALIISKKRK